MGKHFIIFVNKTNRISDSYNLDMPVHASPPFVNDNAILTLIYKYIFPH